MLTDKSNCSQLQVIFQSLDRQCCSSYLRCGVLQIDGLIIFGGLKRKYQREIESGNLMLIFVFCLMSK